jgi:BASS family bile acid:Na+ symporter
VLGILVVAALVGVAIRVRTSPRLSGLAFTVWVAAGVAAALFYPWAFQSVGNYRLTGLIVPLIQIIMFGMGTTLSLADFARVLTMPWGTFVGVVLQFGVMPITGFLLASLFGFEGEVAAGVVLVGASPGGVASNVMTYLAGGNVPLSVTMTACSTLLSPVMTPLAMRLLAGRFVPIEIVPMMLSILNIIVLPIAAGLVVHRLLRGRDWMPRVLPVVSMAAICLIITIITANSRDRLLSVAVALVAVVVLHNTIGYVLGYAGARLLRLRERDARTVSIEVGLQNAGMASGLAIGVLNSTDAGLAAAIFGPWMNISGSILASWWRQRSPSEPA